MFYCAVGIMFWCRFYSLNAVILCLWWILRGRAWFPEQSHARITSKSNTHTGGDIYPVYQHPFILFINTHKIFEYFRRPMASQRQLRWTDVASLRECHQETFRRQEGVHPVKENYRWLGMRSRGIFWKLFQGLKWYQSVVSIVWFCFCVWGLSYN